MAFFTTQQRNNSNYSGAASGDAQSCSNKQYSRIQNNHNEGSPISRTSPSNQVNSFSPAPLINTISSTKQYKQNEQTSTIEQPQYREVAAPNLDSIYAAHPESLMQQLNVRKSPSLLLQSSGKSSCFNIQAENQECEADLIREEINRLNKRLAHIDNRSQEFSQITSEKKEMERSFEKRDQ